MTPLTVLVCGSVDDGKSTLIGRLLYDSGAIPDDQLATLDRGGVMDFSLLTDGLAAEQEQGITIDVAHRQFHAGSRRILLRDCPGHEQYTRNMATGAAGADLAIVLIDAQQGIQTQTRRHVLIASLMGVRALVYVINKMDLVGFDQSRFDAVVASLPAAPLPMLAIPACARDGDGVSQPGDRMSWYDGPTLLDHLQVAETPADRVRAFRLPVQYVIRDGGTRLYAGTVAAGQVATGDPIAVPGAPGTTIIRILGPAGPQATASTGDAISVELTDFRDIGRGAVLSAAQDPVAFADQFQAHLVWCDDAPLLSGRAVLFKLGTRTLAGTISRIRHGIDADTGLPLSLSQLRSNDVAVVNLSLSAPVAYERFADCRALGGFIVIDRQTSATAGAGTIDFALNRSANVTWQDVAIGKPARARLMGQTPLVVWLTGLSGSGKSTIANLVEQRLHEAGRHTYMLDGDNLRHGLCRDLGFTAADRVENVRRVGEVAALMADAGLIVLVCLISPFAADRQAARERVAPGGFLEVFVDAPMEVCRNRDPKGLYARADQGKVLNFTGVSSPYEPPDAPDLHLQTDRLTPAEAASLLAGRILSVASAS